MAIIKKAPSLHDAFGSIGPGNYTPPNVPVQSARRAKKQNAANLDAFEAQHALEREQDRRQRPGLRSELDLLRAENKRLMALTSKRKKAPKKAPKKAAPIAGGMLSSIAKKKAAKKQRAANLSAFEAQHRRGVRAPSVLKK